MNHQKKKQFRKQNISTIPGKSNFYFCKCVIIPHKLSKEKMIINCPIKKTIYDIVKIKDILYMMIHILNLKEDDLIPCILSDDYYSYKIICSGEEYLYEIFKNPIFIKIYFVEQNNKEIKLDNNYIDSNNLLNLFINPEKKIKNIFNREHDNFIIGEEEIKISEHTLTSAEKEKKINANKTCYFKILSFITSQNINNYITLNCLQIPTILKFNFGDSLEKLHIQIRKLFNLPQETNFYTFSSISQLTYNNIEFDNFDIKQLLLNDNELKNDSKIPFVLCIKIEPNTDYNINFKNNKEFYIPIPYIGKSLNFYITFLEQRISYLYSNKYKLKKLRIHIIWLNNYKNYIEKIEENCELNNIIEIDPYNELLREIQEKSENRMLNPLLDTKLFSNRKEQLDIYKLLKYYTDYERYDENNIYHCEFCKKDVIGFKQTLLYNLPDVLIFHFQRKSSEEFNNIKITFPINDYLDLSRFAEDNKTKNKKYELIGIINFEGNTVTGHYNAFCKNPIKNKWYKFNDTVCFIINDIEKEIDYSNVYAVIYKNIEFNEYKKKI